MVKEVVKEALWWKPLKNKVVRCELCPRFCVILPGDRGNCGVRENRAGTLYTLVYGRPCSLALDPIEKKPFYHFMPGKQALSIATAGCNLHCANCQNWEISQAKPEEVPSLHMPPEKVVLKATKENVDIISYTYTEPTIFAEYVLDIAKLAKKAGMKNTIVSNGFINPEPLKQLCRYIDGANIDLKSISDTFYKKVCQARVQPVLDALKIMKEEGIWIEITNLIIPTLNDKETEIKKLIVWIKNNLGVDVPLHFSAFYPAYKLLELPPTSFAILKKARKLAMKAGLHYVYTGNISDEEGSTTFCPKCKKALIKRRGFYVSESNIENGKCSCGETIAGVWK